jgi:DNA polymerase sigma
MKNLALFLTDVKKKRCIIFVGALTTLQSLTFVLLVLTFLNRARLPNRKLSRHQNVTVHLQ